MKIFEKFFSKIFDFFILLLKCSGHFEVRKRKETHGRSGKQKNGAQLGLTNPLFSTPFWAQFWSKNPVFPKTLCPTDCVREIAFPQRFAEAKGRSNTQETLEAREKA